MKAVRLYGAKDIRIDEVEEPGAPEAGWIQVEVGWAGICGSDLHLYADGPMWPATPDVDRPQPVTGANLPFTLGHEFSGTVTALGDGVDGLAVGDRVAVMAGVWCGKCAACKAGKTNLCENRWGLGLSGLGGGLSAKVNMPAKVAVPVGDMALEHAAMIEPLSVSTHGVRLAGVKEGDVVVIGGAGPIGVFAAAVAYAKGARVIISEPNEARRRTAVDTGVAFLGVDPMSEDLKAIVERETNGHMADVAIDAAGVIPVINSLLDVVKVGGHLQLIAIPQKQWEVNIANQLHHSEVTVTGTYGYVREDYEDSIALINSGKLDLDPYISAKISTDEIVDKGFATLMDRASTAVKILVDPRA